MTLQRRLPAEWEPQAGILLTWPHRQSDWAPLLDDVEPVYCQLASLIGRFESLLIACHDADHLQHVHQLLQQQGLCADRYRLHIQPSNDSWARDHGPIGIEQDGQPALLDFRFNGWGNKYAADLDNVLGRGLEKQGAFAVPLYDETDLVLEGGSIDSDGQGSLLTTSACLLNPNRNPGLSKRQLEQQLESRLGVERILWLREGFLQGDDTDSHIDMLARFCDAGTIAATTCDVEEDVHYPPLRRMWAELESWRDKSGKPYRLVALPIPEPVHAPDGERLPASYANFLVINGAVLVPQYGDEQHDALAVKRLQDCFPGRQIFAVNSLPLIRQYGSLHCITMQLPAGTLAD